VPERCDLDGPEIYVIDPARCTECVGHFDEPQCRRCARSIAFRSRPDDRPTLLQRFVRLQAQGIGRKAG
jgi:hypothetical protein